ncbi:A disintegrin and metalloproteinase with thrombospondin motifs 1-like [Diadema antillarum]|uniref:A disintegrin and metalloproteinase with thrombospondin motifs 1-like n=1 Tax=Diadema antillarum TaxID=105358 RepID=UPI003A8A4B1A
MRPDCEHVRKLASSRNLTFVAASCCDLVRPSVAHCATRRQRSSQEIAPARASSQAQFQDVLNEDELRQYSLTSEIKEYDIILPSFSHPSGISKRSLRHAHYPRTHEITFTAFDEFHHLKLVRNDWLMRPGLDIEYLEGDGSIRREPIRTRDCHYFSTSLSHGNSPGAFSTCNELRGVLTIGDDVLYVEPLKNDHAQRVRRSPSETSHPHLIYKRETISEHEAIPCPVSGVDVAGNTGEGESASTVPGNETFYDGPYLGRKYVEVFYLVDSLVFQDFGQETESYAMTIMNIMSRRYLDPSLDIDLRFSVVRFMIATTSTPSATALQGGTVTFTVTADASTTLDDFCDWQAQLSYDDDTNQNDWDLALLFSGEDIYRSNSFSLLGLAKVSGACRLNSKCSITENNGLQAGVVMAHETGHSLSLSHDGVYGCPEDTNIMSAVVPSGIEAFRWSSCSSNFMKIFINTQTCMDDIPGSNLSSIVDLPGLTYDLDRQCQLATGDTTAFSNAATTCTALWCSNPNTPTFRTLRGMPVEGTTCGDGLWCIGGLCVNSTLDVAPAVDGGWTEYGDITLFNISRRFSK